MFMAKFKVFIGLQGLNNNTIAKMKYIKLFSILFFASLLFNSCITLSPTYFSQKAPIEGYTYFYVTPTSERNSISGGTYGTQYGIFGSTSSSSVSPSELIAGYLMNRGFVRIPILKQETNAKTIIINYGDGNMRSGLEGKAIEVTLQFLNAETNEVLCIVRADAVGETEADAIRDATNKCLDTIFANNKK